MKQHILELARRAGVFSFSRHLNRDKFLIVFYHRFTRGDTHPSALPAAAFAMQLAYLKANYSVLPLEEIATKVERGEHLPERVAAITIDDGFHDAYDVAFPILREYALPATLYVFTDFLDRKVWLWTDKTRYVFEHAAAGNYELKVGEERMNVMFDDKESRDACALGFNERLKRVPHETKEEALIHLAEKLRVDVPLAPPRGLHAVTWEQAREMDAKGVCIGSHTVSHPILPNLSEKQLRDELERSRQRLEAELKRPVRDFCYPNGDADERVYRATKFAGYTRAVTTRGGLNDQRLSDLFRLRRIHTEHNFARFVQNTSGAEAIKNRFRRIEI